MRDVFEIEKSSTMPFYPESNVTIERLNRTLQQMLLVNDYKDDWDEHLPLFTMAYRASVQ